MGNGKRETGNRNRETGNGKQRTENRKQDIGRGGLGAWLRGESAGSLSFIAVSECGEECSVLLSTAASISRYR
jgi:hypothetical protein